MNFNVIKSNVLRPPLVRLVLVGLLLVFISAVAAADQFYVTVRVECSKNQSELKIFFRGYWNEAGEKIIANLDPDSFDPWKFVSITQNIDGKYLTQTKSESRTCVFGKNTYLIEIVPLMAPRFHPEGFCATRIGARAIIKLNDKIVANEGVDACTETEMVTTEITLTPNEVTTYKKVTAKEFYGE